MSLKTLGTLCLLLGPAAGFGPPQKRRMGRGFASKLEVLRDPVTPVPAGIKEDPIQPLPPPKLRNEIPPSYPYSAYYSDGSEAWFQNLVSIPGSRVLRRIRGHLGSTVLVAVMFATLFELERSSMVPDSLSEWVRTLYLPALPHEAVGSFIALLLAFRTQQSYERFWEGRMLWDGVFGECRGLVRLLTCVEEEFNVHQAKGLELEAGGTGVPLKDPQLLSPAEQQLLEDADNKRISAEYLDTLYGLIAAYPYALKQHLRGERNLGELLEAAALASAPELRGGACNTSAVVDSLKTVSEASNVPLSLLGAISRKLRRTTAAGDLLWWQLDSHIMQLTQILGKAERIKGTPVPISYSRHTSRFFSIYSFTLPMALSSFENLALLPVTSAVVSWVLFSTEEIGHIIEDPFGQGLNDDPDEPHQQQIEVLPLGRYCAEIASDVASFSHSPRTLTAMPGADIDEDLLFDETT